VKLDREKFIGAVCARATIATRPVSHRWTQINTDKNVFSIRILFMISSLPEAP
jgi:hypothetical protein